MNANPRHPDGHDEKHAASGEPRIAEVGRGARRPTPRDFGGLFVAGPRQQSANVVIPPALHGLLKEAARRERTALSVIVVRALRAYLSEVYPDLYRRLMPLPADWDARASAPADVPPHGERPTDS